MIEFPMNSESNPPKNDKLKIGERKDRLWLVLLFTGLILFLLSFAMKKVSSLFFISYTNNLIPVNVGSFIIPILLTASTVIAFYLLKYYFFELRNFCKFDSDDHRKYFEEKSDESYKSLLYTLYIQVIFTSLTISILLTLFAIASIIAKIIILFAPILFLILYWNTTYDYIKIFIQKYLPEKFSAVRYIIANIFLFCIWIIVSAEFIFR